MNQTILKHYIRLILDFLKGFRMSTHKDLFNMDQILMGFRNML